MYPKQKQWREREREKARKAREGKKKMGKVVEKKKKRKGRPSLLDLQKRNIREQQEQEQQLQLLQRKKKLNSYKDGENYKIATGTPVRRSTRRNPNPSPEIGSEGEEEDDDKGNRREKELKLVLKLQKSSGNSNASDLDEIGSGNHKKRKVNAIGGGSRSVDHEKGEESISATNPTNNIHGAQLESGPSTPLPDKTLLLFILDRLQKKDTYGVFSESVDPEELPDYREIIQHPMDFGTVRRKLNNRAYANLEQFEKDIFLICSNAMQYNAPDTIYFRQARSIQELAKRNFENLRQNSDDNEPETKVARRGRPPTKNFKKPLGRPSLERAHTEFSTYATLATGTENAAWTNHDLRKGTLHLDKYGIVESSGRFDSFCNDVNAVLLSENKFDRDEVLMPKGYSMKHGKKPFVHDENRRATYTQFHQSGREPSVLTTFDAERKQLMTVGLHSEHGYTRSLARFAANLGPVAWKVAAKRIERCLPTGAKFGPGWVGENDIVPQMPLLLSSSPVGLRSSSQPFLIPKNLSSATSHTTVKLKGEKLTERSEEDDSSEKSAPSTNTPLDNHLRKPNSSSLSVANRSLERVKKAEVVEGLNSHTGFNILNSSMGAINTRLPSSIHQNSVSHPGMNGFNSTYRFNLPSQMGKLIGAARPAGFSFQSSQMLDRVSRTNTKSEDPNLADNTNTINPGRSMPISECKASATSLSGNHQSTWQGLDTNRKTDSGLSPQQKPDAVPPDLNVRFHSPGSPSSSRVYSTQPDLALQL